MVDSAKMDNQDDVKLLLVRYITNQATETEAAGVKRWIKLHPENELYYIELYEAWQNILYVEPQVVDEEKAYELFAAKMFPRQKPPVGKWIKIAVVFMLFACSITLLLRYQPGHKIASQLITAQKGSLRKIVLSDGTQVWLNALSSIKYDDGFGKTNRTVYLEGEAFFDIAHGENKAPFLVKTQNYTVRDIGTKFNLKAYPNDPFFETTVIKGEVAVEGNSGSNSQDFNRIYVKPKQALKIYYNTNKSEPKEILTAKSKTYNEVQVTEVDSAKMDIYDGWKDDHLLFDGNTLEEIAKVLERRYDVKINLDNRELKDIRYSGGFQSVPTIDKVLLIIKQNTPINYTINKQTITITKNK
jgi:transmembrane sensor